MGLQYLIWKKIDAEDVSWVPIEGGDEANLGEKIAELEKEILNQRTLIEEL